MFRRFAYGRARRGLISRSIPQDFNPAREQCGQGRVLACAAEIGQRHGLRIASITRMGLNGTTVLVVEDDAVNRAGLVRLLQYEGLLVEYASSVADALSKLSARPAIVLLDVNLPDGSGVELLRHIRSKRVPAKVCILTGSAQPDTLEQIERLQPDGLLLKPFHPQELLKWVRNTSVAQNSIHHSD